MADETLVMDDTCHNVGEDTTNAEALSGIRDPDEVAFDTSQAAHSVTAEGSCMSMNFSKMHDGACFRLFQ